MIGIETGHYIKGMHNLMNAHFDLRNYQKFDETLQEFILFSKSKIAQQHDNNRVQTFIYLVSAKINKHISTGTFKRGWNWYPIQKKTCPIFFILRQAPYPGA